jgi:hypothetical protein
VTKNNLTVLALALVVVVTLAVAYVLVANAAAEIPGRETPAGLLH